MASVTEINGSKTNLASCTTSKKSEEILETNLDSGSSPIASVTTGPASMAISIQTSEFSELKIMRTKMSGSRTTALGHSYPYVTGPTSNTNTNGNSSSRPSSPYASGVGSGTGTVHGEGEETGTPSGSGRSSSNPNSPLLSSSSPQVRVTSFSRSSTTSPDYPYQSDRDRVDGSGSGIGTGRRINLHESDPSLMTPRKYTTTSVHTSQPISDRYKFFHPSAPPTSLSLSRVPPGATPTTGTSPVKIHQIELSSSSPSISSDRKNQPAVKSGHDVKMREAFQVDAASKTGTEKKKSSDKGDPCTDFIVFLDECFMCHGE